MKTAKIITWILTLLGFSATQTACMYAPVPMPYGAYKLSGTVSNEDGDPISGIRISVRPTADEHEISSTKSDTRGAFFINTYNLPDDRIDVIAEDLDGPANGGEFKSVTKNVPISDQMHIDFVLEPTPAPEPETPDPEPETPETPER